MLHCLGFCHHQRMNLFWQTMLWSGLAIGAGLWAMHKCGFHTPLCQCGHPHNGQEGCECH